MRTRLSPSVALLAGILVVSLLLAGCGGGGDSGSGSSYDSGSPGFETGGPSVSFSAPSGKVPPSAGAITITGTPTEGAENGCIVMQAGNTLYLLLGGDPSVLMSGRPVVVRGTPEPGLMTTCQQGTPFRVAEVKPA
jgi:hypothetical protein